MAAKVAAAFEARCDDMILWPASSLRIANKAQERLYTTLKRDGSTAAMLPDMQTGQELYDTIGLNAIEALDATLVASVAPR